MPVPLDIARWIASFVDDGHGGGDRDEQLLARELLPKEQLEAHARDLARWHQVDRKRGSNALLPRLAENAKIIRRTCDSVAAVLAKEGRVPPAGEWLLDNNYLVEEQVRLARRHLPKSYSRELPRLTIGSDADFPRVYALALEYIAHVDGRVESDSIGSFIAAYQEQVPLTLGELWAVPIVLRLALIENLRRVCVHLLRAADDQTQASRWATRMLAEAESAPQDIVLVVADLARAGLQLRPAFVAEFTRRLTGQHTAMSVALSWVESQLIAVSTTIEQQVARERQIQSTDQVSIAATIGSLRMLDAVDWRVFVEQHAVVERILGNDPAAAYPAMDFATRDSYRHAIEGLARHARREEPAVAQQVVDLAAAAEGRARHVGWWLKDAGMPALNRVLGTRRPFRHVVGEMLLNAPLLGYLAATTALTVLLLTVLAVALPLPLLPVIPPALAITVAVIALLALSSPALAVIQRLLAPLVPPRPLARMDFSEGIPADQRTAIAVPCMLTSTADTDRLIVQMEVRHLGNPDAQLVFVLLSDLPDADRAELPGDAALVLHARKRIAELNRRHQHGKAGFLLLHRPRIHVPAQGTWMGWERKRGKLSNLNHLLLTGDAAAFSVIEGDRTCLRDIRSVIVLDADTQLPPGTAAQLIGAIAHPLNRPQVDARTKLVVAGHALIQPRLAVTLPSASSSLYAGMCAGEAGIDPYTHAVSDTYQDLFDEGSFVGKGIYDVAAFEAVLGERFPDNRILSHDLIEGCFLRSGLDSGTLVLEEYPSRYLADIARRHRWVRGDWQIARWLLPRPPGRTGPMANPLSMLSRWKIFDNLRRNLAGIAWLTLLVAAGALPYGLAAATLLALAWFLPVLIGAVVSLAAGSGHAPVMAWVVELLRGARRSTLERLTALIWLPHEVACSIDAILRTGWRLLTGRRLLAWTTAAESERRVPIALPQVVRQMWQGPLAAAVVLALAWWTEADPLPAAVLALLWLPGGVLAWTVSRTITTDRAVLSMGRQRWFRRLARQTYAYFEDLCGESAHHLPPDNIHLADRCIAHRTSPTNIGLKLLADLGARDLGQCGLQQMFDRLAGTNTLDVLRPRYVSTVDSGNLVGHCLVLRQGLLALPDAPVWTAAMATGLVETWSLVDDALRAVGSSNASSERSQIAVCLRRLEAAGDRPDRVTLREIATLARDVATACGDNQGDGWPRRFASQAAALQHDVDTLLPWCDGRTPGGADGHALAAARTLRGIAGLRQALTSGSGDVPAAAAAAATLIQTAHELAHQLGELAEADFSFLLDPQRELFVIGYHVTEHRADQSCYDLLASEARLASYIAVAQHQVDQEHWFRLGRLVIDTGSGRALVSWSGSMFEYLMPALVMPSPDRTLLGETCRAVVERQIAYGRSHGVPWGVSESGYHRTDQHLTYQYRAFGVPGLGLKRGLADDLVIAPYASLMALPIAPEAVWDNLQRLLADGVGCVYGMVEAIDYTRSRLPPGQDHAVVQQVMVHHQGMAFLGMVDVLAGSPMQRRFLADAELRSMELLLHERVPYLAEPAEMHASEVTSIDSNPAADAAPLRVITDPTQRDEVALLSNGRYHVMVGAGGGGWSRWHQLAVTRWREDPTLEAHGCFVILRDLVDGQRWSTAFQPMADTKSGRTEAIFTQAKAEFRRLKSDIDCHTEIVVSPEDDVEVRRVTLRNQGQRERLIEITTYAEVVIATQASDESHPAFSNLFVQTESVAERTALLATRRPRTAQEHPPWLIHLATVHGATSQASWTTDRAAFIGRGRTLANPAAFDRREKLDGVTGAVIDPAIAIRQVVRIPPEGRVVIDVVLGMAESREAAMVLIGRYAEQRFCDRAFELAWTYAQVTLRQLGIDEPDAQQFAHLAGSIVHATAFRRAPASLLARNKRGQSGLWAYGVSGDNPIVVVRIEAMDVLDLVRMAVKAHAWWRRKGLVTDLVIMADDHSVYRQGLVDAITGVVAASPDAALIDRPGGIFVRRGDQMGDEDRLMFQAMARMVLSGQDGSFAEQIERRPRLGERIPLLEPRRAAPAAIDAPLARRDDLMFRNRWGGFTRDGREYVLVLAAGEAPPQPWVNVIANPTFGAVVTERGGGYTWLENCHEFRLTPWGNDPVGDRSGEAFYLRDENNGRVWSPTPGPIGRHGNWVVRHGFGYTAFEHFEDRIASELWTYVATDAPVRFWSLTLRNHGNETRRISIAAFVEWVLGEQRSRTASHIVTASDPRSGALTARNPHHSEFAGRVAFLDCSERERSCTADRSEFIGVGGNLSHPAALRRTRLSNRTGAGLDPCAAMLTTIEIAPGQERQVTFILGVGASADDVQQLIQRYRGVSNARRALEQVWAYWNHTLGCVHVETPDPAIDHLVNGWLVYQVLSCRVWARTGFFQSGGAFGFRDQLQDVMALTQVTPATTRAHLVRAAGRQFREGDVQHWWHPPANRGVRTRFSDDLLWLPLAVARYVGVTGDTGVLGVEVPFIEGRPVGDQEEAYYDQPAISDERATIYEHAARTIDLACSRIGVHGLPLIGCGDWNDGMNLVGQHGRGESVWLAFFLWEVIRVYAPIAVDRNDLDRARRWQKLASSLVTAIEGEAWDGDWYRRATMDDGRWLGSASADECQIDALPQSWAVLTGFCDPARARTAMAAVDRRLVRREDHLIQLFDPPFDHGSFDPGYIKGYLPGVRENGGQYTHAALWTVMAFARLGDAPRAWELFDLLNPVNHADNAVKASTYRAEPYVIAADVYAVAPHVGRGGWTWYTGSAGWCYRLLVEELLGIQRDGGHLLIKPLMRPEWPGFTVHYRHNDTTFYHVVVTRRSPGDTVLRLQLDGVDCTDGRVALCDDHQHHQVAVDVGSR
jgi:cyclic beta-1,2-glucan synthetase